MKFSKWMTVAGRPDRLEPGRVVLPRVAQEPDGVAEAQLAVGDAREGPVEATVVRVALPMPREDRASWAVWSVHARSTHEG